MPDTMSLRAVALLECPPPARIVRAELVPRLLITALISLSLIHLNSLPRYAAMFPDADFTSPAAVAHARDQITAAVLHEILSPATPDAEHLAPSFSSRATLAPVVEEA